MQPSALHQLTESVHNFDMAKPKETLEEQYARVKATADKRLGQLKARMQAQQAREKTNERKADTRRKIILGGLAKVHMTRNPDSDFAKRMMAMIDEYTVGDAERKLFDLPLLSEDEQKKRRSKHRTERKDQGETEIPF